MSILARVVQYLLINDPTTPSNVAMEGTTLTRQEKFCWMKDILEHLGNCYEQLQMSDPDSDRYLAESINRDLEEFRRLCNSLRRDSHEVASRHAVV